MEFIKHNRAYIILILLAIIAFQVDFGLWKLNPMNVNWIFSEHNDWATHYLGWAFYRDAPWQFPLGEMKNYNYPVGTNIGFTDSIPLFAVFLKPLSFLLPQNFQYLGIWLLFCLFLNGYYAFKIFRFFGVSEVAAFIFTVFILINPVLVYREIHPALCAHWLLLGPLYLYISVDRDNLKKRTKTFLLLLAASCLVTPYLAVVVLGMLGVFAVRVYIIDKIVSLKKAILLCFSGLVILVFLWLLLGILAFSKHIDNDSAGFYGIYKMNLNALYNPLRFSKFFSAQPLVSEYQQDSFMYLGISVLLMGIAGLLFYLKDRPLIVSYKKWLPLLLFSLGLFAFAVTDQISWNAHNLFTIPLMHKISRIGDVFRASGRFFWLVYYLIVIASLVLFYRISFLKGRVGIAVISLLLILQAYEVSPVYARVSTESTEYNPKLNIAGWNTLFSQFRNIITVKPYSMNLVRPMDYQDIAYFAYRNHNNVSEAYTARSEGKAMQQFSRKILGDIIDGNLDPDNLYISSRDNLKYFSTAFSKNLVSIVSFDDYYFIFSNKKQLAKYPAMTPVEQHELQQAVLENAKAGEFEKQEALLLPSRGKVQFHVDNKLVTNRVVQLEGWAFIDGKKTNASDTIEIVLKSAANNYTTTTVPKQRKDVTIVYKAENLDNAGFESFAFTHKVVPGTYNLIIAVKDKEGRIFYSGPEQKIEIKN